MTGDWENYESGPYCPHYVEIGCWCRHTCERCDHPCAAHNSARGVPCEFGDCDCPGMDQDDRPTI